MQLIVRVSIATLLIGIGSAYLFKALRGNATSGDSMIGQGGMFGTRQVTRSSIISRHHIL